ncbi:hypothetical protein D3C71_1884390 [compost metagenome]
MVEQDSLPSAKHPPESDMAPAAGTDAGVSVSVTTRQTRRRSSAVPRGFASTGHFNSIDH